MSALLTINCIAAQEPRAEFDAEVLPRLLTRWQGASELVHLSSADALPSPDAFSHLLLTGSELSAAQDNPRDAELMDCIRSFVEARRSVYGICYGHQMLARALGGACRRAERPEFGWRRVRHAANGLWEGLDDLIVVHSHYDEVHALPAEFDVIASTPDCAVQAFQWRDSPVWGTQFHAEFSGRLGNAMLRDNLRSEPLAASYWRDEFDDPWRPEWNLRIFENFFES